MRVSTQKYQFPRCRKQHSSHSDRYFLQSKKNCRCDSTPAEQACEEKHGGQRPDVTAPRRRSLRMSRSPVGSPNLCPYVRKKQNSEQNRYTAPRYFDVRSGRSGIFFMQWLAKGHPQKHKRQRSANCPDDIEKQRDVRRARRQHSERRGRNCAGAPSQIHDVQSRGAALSIHFAYPQVRSRRGESVAKAIDAAGRKSECKRWRIEESKAEPQHRKAQCNCRLESFCRDQSARNQNAYERS